MVLSNAQERTAALCLRHRLPLELVQLVLSFLDPILFQARRLVHKTLANEAHMATVTELKTKIDQIDELNEKSKVIGIIQGMIVVTNSNLPLFDLVFRMHTECFKLIEGDDALDNNDDENYQTYYAVVDKRTELVCRLNSIAPRNPYHNAPPVSVWMQQDFLNVIRELKVFLGQLQDLLQDRFQAGIEIMHKISFINYEIVELVIDLAHNHKTLDVVQRQVAELLEKKVFFHHAQTHLNNFTKDVLALMEQVEHRLNTAQDLHVIHDWVCNAFTAIAHASNCAMLDLSSQLSTCEIPFFEVLRISWKARLPVKVYMNRWWNRRAAAIKTKYVKTVIPFPLDEGAKTIWSKKWTHSKYWTPQTAAPGSSIPWASSLPSLPWA
jgi:hypothetical protein